MTIFARKTQPHTMIFLQVYYKGDVMVSGVADKEEVVLMTEGVLAKRKREKASDCGHLSLHFCTQVLIKYQLIF